MKKQQIIVVLSKKLHYKTKIVRIDRNLPSTGGLIDKN